MSLLVAYESIGELNDAEIADTVKPDIKTPCYGEYEFVVHEDVYTPMAADEKDQYESNNSFSATTRLNSQPSGEPTDINVSINATLHRESWLWGVIERDVGEDYYRVDVFGNASVTITLTNISFGCDYDLKLYKYDNIMYAGEEDISLIAASVRASNNDESITQMLAPGTYYIWVYSYNDECDDSIYYNLSVSATYTAEDITISSLRFNKGAKAAMWISDYDPCGIEPFSKRSKVEVGVRSYDTLTSTLSFQNPYTQYFTDPDGIEHAALYVWDKNFRNDIRSALGTYYTQIANEVTSTKELIANVEYVESIVSGTTITGIVITVCLASNTATIIASVTLAVVPTIFGVVANALLPEGSWVTTRENMLNYIANLRTALETSAQTSDNEVVKIVTKYKYSSYSYPATSVTSYYFDFTPTIQTEYLYESDTITAWNNDSVVYGKVYGIVGTDDMNNAINRVNYTLPDVNTSSITDIYVNSSIPGELYIGEYHWYKFTAPGDGRCSFFAEKMTLYTYK